MPYSESLEQKWTQEAVPKIKEFIFRPLYPYTVRKILAPALFGKTSLPEVISGHIRQESERLAKFCGHLNPNFLQFYSDCKYYYPFGPNHIDIAILSLRTPNWDDALKYLMYGDKDFPSFDLDAFNQCLTRLVDKLKGDNSGFSVLDWITSS